MYICPAIKKYWELQEKEMMEKLKMRHDDRLVLAGDGRCDSPGMVISFI